MALAALSPRRPAGRREPPVTDEALLVAIAQGERAALAQLHERHAGLIFRVARRAGVNPAEAEDVTQELFVRVWQRAGLYDPARGSAIGWLRRVAHNLAVNHVRSRVRAAVACSCDDPNGLALRLANPEADIERDACRSEQQQAVRAALGALPAAQRSVVVWAYFGGLSQTQVAARLGLPLGTVKSRTAHGLRRLRALLEPAGVAPPRPARATARGPRLLPAPGA